MLDRDGERLETLRGGVRAAEDSLTELRQQADSIEKRTREARKALEAIHTELSELEVSRATEESHLTHLAQSCVDTLQLTLDEVVAEVQQARPRRSTSRRGADEPRSARLQVGPTTTKKLTKPKKAPTPLQSLQWPHQPLPRNTSCAFVRRSIGLARST